MNSDNFPIISNRRLETLIKELEGISGVLHANIFKRTTNNGVGALHVGIDFSRKVKDNYFDTMEEVMDETLGKIGLYFCPTDKADEKFGKSKYYFHKTKNGIWVASGDNCYGFDQGEGKPFGGRILLDWQERVPRSYLEDGLSENKFISEQD